MSKICTNIEQSKKLLELELSPETADMCFTPIMSIEDGKNHGYLNIPDMLPFRRLPERDKELYLPCWSLGALLDFMPKYITEDNLTYIIRIIPTNDNKIEMCYWDIYSGRIISNYIREETFIEAAYNMIIWLLENNCVKEEEK